METALIIAVVILFVASVLMLITAIIALISVLRGDSVCFSDDGAKLFPIKISLPADEFKDDLDGNEILGNDGECRDEKESSHDRVRANDEGKL